MSTNYYLELPIRLEPGQRLHTETIVEVTADNIIQAWKRVTGEQ